MESLRKTVIVCCLIYAIYGLTSYIEVNTFVPPIPLKPFLILAIIGVYVAKIRPINTVFILGLTWLFSMVFEGTYLVDSFLSVNQVEFYDFYISPLVFIASLSVFVLLIYFLSNKFFQKGTTYFLSSISLILAIYVLTKSSRLLFHGMIILMSLSFIILMKIKSKSKETENSPYQGVLYSMYGIAIINILELIATIHNSI